MSQGFKLTSMTGPAALVVLSAYSVFFLIGPFFLLGIDRIPMSALLGDSVMYEDTFGVSLMVATVILFSRGIALYLAGIFWLLGLVRFLATKKRWIAVALLVAPIPIAYYYFGPYHVAMYEWLGWT